MPYFFLRRRAFLRVPFLAAFLRRPFLRVAFLAAFLRRAFLRVAFFLRRTAIFWVTPLLRTRATRLSTTSIETVVHLNSDLSSSRDLGKPIARVPYRTLYRRLEAAT